MLKRLKFVMGEIDDFARTATDIVEEPIMEYHYRIKVQNHGLKRIDRCHGTKRMILFLWIIR